MTIDQEDALYDFLDTVTSSFDLDVMVTFISMVDPTWKSRLADEVRELLTAERLAFECKERRWISKRGFFEPIPFVIKPTRLELQNGIVIPGHRCVPFANPRLLPREYTFNWKGSPVPGTTAECEPEELYPYYYLYGEEYAPQYVARDNPQNEAAVYSNPYDELSEVSICTLDMRTIFRETAFVPGDCFVVRTLDWRKGIFSMEKADEGCWSDAEKDSWLEAAEAGFEKSFAELGPGVSTEEQIAYAYWYGGERMAKVPAYSLEEYLFEKTERVDVVPFGIETRFWYMGREIPDYKELAELPFRTDKTPIERFFESKKIPVTELVISSYLRDALYRGEKDCSAVLDRIIPPGIHISPRDRIYCNAYLAGEFDGIRKAYSPFTDKSTGPVRQRLCELYTAVIEFAARLEKENIARSWMPQHACIVFSQIQSHAAIALEDVDADEAMPDDELETIDDSVDNMIETYEDLKESIEEALEGYRRNRFSLVRAGEKEDRGWLVQLRVNGTDIWRRILLSGEISLEDIHGIIQNVFGWKDSFTHRFSEEQPLDNETALDSLETLELGELLYEYGPRWTVNVMFLGRPAAPEKLVWCVAGAGTPPPETIGGPLRFRRLVAALSGASAKDRAAAEKELGADFQPDAFDAAVCNQRLDAGGFWGRNKKNGGNDKKQQEGT